MRELELKLKERWAMRLVHLILPYSDEMPEVALRMAMPNPMHELRDMFGSNRWSGRKSHVHCIEKKGHQDDSHTPGAN